MKSTFTLIFYLFSFAAILNEIMSAASPKKAVRFIKSYKGKEFNEFNEKQRNYSYLTLLYFFWVFIGLFTSQFVCFIAILILCLIPQKYWILKWIDSILTLAVLVFILVNKYHLHINVFEYLKSFFE